MMIRRRVNFAGLIFERTDLRNSANACKGSRKRHAIALSMLLLTVVTPRTVVMERV